MSTTVTTVSGLVILNPEPFTATDEDLWGFIENTNRTNMGAYFKAPNLEVNAIGNTGGNVAINYTNGPIQTMTATSNITDFTISNFATGEAILLVVTQDGTGSRTFTDTASNFLTPGGVAVVLSTPAASIDILTFRQVASNVFLGVENAWA